MLLTCPIGRFTHQSQYMFVCKNIPLAQLAPHSAERSNNDSPFIQFIFMWLLNKIVIMTETTTNNLCTVTTWLIKYISIWLKITIFITAIIMKPPICMNSQYNRWNYVNYFAVSLNQFYRFLPLPLPLLLDDCLACCCACCCCWFCFCIRDFSFGIISATCKNIDFSANKNKAHLKLD